MAKTTIYNQFLMKHFKSLLFIYPFILHISITSFGQIVELGEIHSEKNDKTSVRLHVKEVIPFEGKTKEELHQLMEDWYKDVFVSKQVIYRYTRSYTNGDNEWKEIHDHLPSKGARKPFDANTEDRILTPHIKCNNCLRSYRSDRRNSNGYFRLDMRMKEGKVQLVLFEPFDIIADSWVSLWVIEDNELVAKPDPRLEAIEQLFLKTKQSLIEYSLQYQAKPVSPNGVETKKGIDDW